MFDVEIVSNDGADFNVYETIEVNFSKSVEFNPKLLFEIDKVYKRTLNNRAKFALGCFHLNIFDSMENIVRNTDESGDFIADLSEFIADYFDKLEQGLNICSLREFDEFIHILKLSSIIMEDAIKENDMELLFEAFYQIQSRFKKENLVDLQIFYFNHDFTPGGLYEGENVCEFSTTLKEIIEVKHVEL